MSRRNRERDPKSVSTLTEKNQTSDEEIGTLDESLSLGSEVQMPPPAPDPEPEKPRVPKPVQVVEPRTETLERFCKMLPSADQYPFLVEVALEARRANQGRKKTVRKTRDEWQRRYQDWKTRARY